MTSDRVMDHLFTFLSFCAPQPIPKDVIVDYVKTMEVYDDEETIGAKIKRCPLMLFDEEESGVYLRVQEVVHCCVSAVTNSFSKETRQNRTVTSLCKFKDLDSLVFATKIVLRLEKVITDIEHLLFKGGASHFRGIIFTSFNPRESRELRRAKEYQDRALDIFLKKLGPGHVDVAKS